MAWMKRNTSCCNSHNLWHYRQKPWIPHLKDPSFLIQSLGLYRRQISPSSPVLLALGHWKRRWRSLAISFHRFWHRCACLLTSWGAKSRHLDRFWTSIFIWAVIMTSSLSTCSGGIQFDIGVINHNSSIGFKYRWFICCSSRIVLKYISVRESNWIFRNSLIGCIMSRNLLFGNCIQTCQTIV